MSGKWQKLWKGCLAPQSKISNHERHEIQGVIFEVYHEMGSGFLEAVNQGGLKENLHVVEFRASARWS